MPKDSSARYYKKKQRKNSKKGCERYHCIIEEEKTKTKNMVANNIGTS